MTSRLLPPATALAALAALAALLAATPAQAADRRFTVTGFDRIRIDGPYEVTLKTGVAPFATATGDRAALDRVRVSVEGRTLVVGAASGGWGGYPGQAPGKVTLALGTHDLNQAWINGAGVLAIDRVKGLGFALSVQGAGRIDIGDVRVDQLKASLAGAASARLAGTAPMVDALVRGTSALDAAALKARDIRLGVDGPSVVKAQATSSAKIDAAGPVTVELTGGAACTVKAAGSAAISGC